MPQFWRHQKGTPDRHILILIINISILGGFIAAIFILDQIGRIYYNSIYDAGVTILHASIISKSSRYLLGLSFGLEFSDRSNR